LIERLLPERVSPLTRCLDPSALAVPIAAVEAVRRTIARALGAVCGSVHARLGAASPGGESLSEKDAATVSEAADALRQAQIFISDVDGPPESDDEQKRLTGTLHALDHACRLAETAREGGFGATATQPSDARAVQLCAEAMQRAAEAAGGLATLPEDHPSDPPAAKGEALVTPDAGFDAPAMSGTQALARLEYCAKEMGDLQRAHRAETLGAAASGTLTANDAMARVDAVRILESLTHHAWRSAAHLVGQAE
jgi:phosphate:Na+ symporter